jgi:murein tripeptide amidase MpaA
MNRVANNPVTISNKFDGGNITVIDSSNPNDIQLAIKPDNASDFFQWFYFRLDGGAGQRYRFRLVNAGEASFAEGWNNYQVCTSYDRQHWFRTPTEYRDGELHFEITLTHNRVEFAYFVPYSEQRHLDLIARAQMHPCVTHSTLGQSLDGRAISLLRVSACEKPQHKVWITARQHPGETMAEWFMEGLMDALLDRNNATAWQLLQSTAFYLVPNINPDGSVRGNLRTNAAGINLNREWQSPSLEKSPEVFLVREAMLAEGGDVFLDIHGDEVIPYVFVAGCEGNPGYNDRHRLLEDTFKANYKQASPDFQDQHGYPKSEPGQGNMTIAANWLGEQFKTLSFTIEMPFKENDDLPNSATGWSGRRSAQLGRDVLAPVRAVLALIDEKNALSSNPTP